VDWADPAYDDLWKQAAVETDPEQRMALYADAEKILIDDQAVIAPLYWYRTPQLVRPNVKLLIHHRL
jgi:oligopeptide transport system substrate-binding protein